MNDAMAVRLGKGYADLIENVGDQRQDSRGCAFWKVARVPPSRNSITRYGKSASRALASPKSVTLTMLGWCNRPHAYASRWKRIRK